MVIFCYSILNLVTLVIVSCRLCILGIGVCPICYSTREFFPYHHHLQVENILSAFKNVLDAQISILKCFGSVLRLTKTMESIEVVPGANLIKFFGDFEVNNVIKADGIVTGFNESPVSFTSHGADLAVKVFEHA